MFEYFDRRQLDTTEATINLVVGGDGPPLLLLHGCLQTHIMWRKVAPALAERYTVVAPDLRGYGESSEPRGTPDHSNYSFRAMAQDQVEVTDEREIDNAPGTVVFLRAPGFLGSDERPFHTITEIGAPRVSFGLRKLREAAKP